MKIYTTIVFFILFSLTCCRRNERRQPVPIQGSETNTEKRIISKGEVLKVNTTIGYVLGHKIMIANKTLIEYLGIPFAKPPLNNLRFKEPHPYERNSFNKNITDPIFIADTIAKTCFQNIDPDISKRPSDHLIPQNEMSEDCLQLNMWIPKPNAKKSVLVFIHGGGFTSQSSSLSIYNGSILAVRTGSIVVSINYRLGFFGFSQLGENDEIPGNMGLLDQQMALRWIYENIEEFKGDRNNITIYGDEAGSASVSAHLISRGSRQYFSKVIMSSGSVFNKWASKSSDFIKKSTKEYAIKSGCNNKTDNDTVNCLQKLNPSQLLINTTLPIGPIKVLTSTRIDEGVSIFQMMYNKTFLSDGKDKIRKRDKISKRQISEDHGESPSSQIVKVRFNRSVTAISKLLNISNEYRKNLSQLYNEFEKENEKSLRLLSEALYECDMIKFALNISSSLTSKYYFVFNHTSGSKFLENYTYTDTIGPETYNEIGGRSFAAKKMQGNITEYLFGYPFRKSSHYLDRKIRNEKNLSNNIMKKECVNDVVDESGSSGKPLLIEALYNISITLTVEKKVIFEQFIIELEELFISDNYTSIEIAMQSSFKIHQFFLKYPEFYDQCKYLSIGSWGTFYELFQVGVYLAADKFTGCLVHNEFGKFDLIEAFLEFQSKCGDAVAFETYISQLTLILESTTYTESEKYSLIYQMILQIIAQFPDMKDEFLNLEIGEFGSVFMLQEISVQYYRMEQIKVLFEGEPKCEFVSALYASLSDSKYQLSSSNKGYLKILFDRFSTIIGNNTLTYAEKIKAISYQYRQFIKTFDYLEETILSFEISTEFGTFGDFLAMFAFGESQGCYPEYFLTFSEITTEVVTTENPTTETQTTVSVTGDCATASSYVLQVVDGTSILYSYASTTWSTWAAIEKANWKSLCTRIYTNFITNTSMSDSEKVTSIIAEINAYVAFYYYREANVHAIEIGTWGTIGQLCTC
uniref:Acetylcholinesterase n=1 Tax=Parastrongyloides trichosuri TaxID=131310 RepID=A0A0N4ZX33_PARTI